MPVETRRIEFSEDELIPAVLEYCRESRIPVPDAAYEAYMVGTDPNRLITLTFAVANPVDQDELTLSSSQLVSALLAFCRRNNISLPPEEAKSVVQEDGHLALLFECRRRTRAKGAAA